MSVNDESLSVVQGIIFPTTFIGSYDLFYDSCSSSPKLTECLQKKKEVIDQMEVKLDTGIDRSVLCISLYHLKLMYYWEILFFIKIM